MEIGLANNYTCILFFSLYSPYRSHPNTQHGQLGTQPILPHLPRAQAVNMVSAIGCKVGIWRFGEFFYSGTCWITSVLISSLSLSFPSPPPPKIIQPGGRVLLTNVPNQPLLPMQPGLAGPNARAPTVFPQNVAVVPQPLHQQLLQNPTAAGLPAPPFYLPPQPQFAATQQPINLGMTNTAQLGAASAPQQISTGMHTMPAAHLMAAVNTGGTGTMTQVPPTSTTSYRGMSAPASRPPTQTAKRSRAIKIIDPDTKMEVSMGSSKPETQQPTPLDTSSISAPVMSGVTPPFTAPPTGHGTGNVVQDFKRMVHERNTTGAVTTQSAVTTTTVAHKPPPPNAIITDPNNKVGEISNKIGVSEVSSSKPRFDVDLSAQQPKSLLGSVPTTSTTTAQLIVSESDQKFRDEFRQKVLQSVNQTTPLAEEEKEKASQEVVEVRNGSQEASIASQNVGENQKEALLPTPLSLPLATSAPLNVTPDESLEVQVGEKTESIAPSEDKNATVPNDSATQTTSSSSEQVEAPPSEAQTDVQPAPVQPEEPESDETNSKEVEDVSPPAPIAVSTSTEESVVKVEDVPEKSLEEESAQSIQVDDTSSQVITDSETPATATATVTEPQVERETVKLEEASGEKLEEEQVESSPVTQEIPEVEPPKSEEKEEEEKPSTSKGELEQKEKEPVKKAEAASAVPSSAVLVSESSVPAKVKEEVPSTEEVSGDVASDASRTEVPDSIKSEKKVEEVQPAVADQQEPLLSSESAAQEKVNGETKESLPLKQVQQDERSDAVPATKPVKQEKPVNEAKSSPPTKPKEVVKPAEQNVKPEKQDRPVSAKPVAAVPASAQLAPGEHLLESNLVVHVDCMSKSLYDHSVYG